ncbi:hypothetical protein ABIC03_005229 [Bradyrhizobium sp. RT6a]
MISNASCAASNTRFVKVAPAQDLMRAIVPPFGAKTKTSPMEACEEAPPFLVHRHESVPKQKRSRVVERHGHDGWSCSERCEYPWQIWKQSAGSYGSGQ